MKKFLISMVLIFTVFLIACGEETAKWTVSDYAPEGKTAQLQATPALTNTIAYTASENPIDDYFDYYIGDASILEGIAEYVYLTSAETAVAEAGIFKVKDKETADALLAAFDTRAQNLAITFENYSPEDTAIAQNMKKGSFDDIVWFVASSDNDSVKAIIEK